MESEGQTGGSAAPRTSWINQVVAGRYEILEAVGEGPLLAAFRARDRQLNRIVAVKILRAALESRAEVVEPLRQGFSESLSLSHDAIARGYDVGQDPGRCRLYYVEEFVRGIDLKERIRRAAPFQINVAVDIAATLAEALEYAHGRGVPHGDLRPQNILVGPEGAVKLTGFGVVGAQAPVLTEDPGLLQRTVAYIAPDAATSALPTASADLYALAVILFEMLTGEAPYRGDNPLQVALKHAQEPVPSPRVVNQAVPRALEGIVMKGLGKTPAERYASATEMLQDLRTVQEALRYGRPLSWSPLDSDLPTVAAVAAAPAPRVMPVPSPETGALSAPSRRVATAVVPPPAARESAVSLADPEEEMTRHRSRGINWLTALNLFLFIVLASVIGFGVWLSQGFIKPVSEVVIPNLVGKTEAEAQGIASEQKFKLVVVDRQYRDKPEAGIIYQQRELVGSRLKEGKPISVWVSLGPEMVDIPDVTNTAQDKAQRLLEKSFLKLGEVSGEYDPLVPRGNVLRQSPQPGEKRPRGTAIDLIVSKGEEPLPTPEPMATTAPSSGGGAEDGELKSRTFNVPATPYKVPRDGAAHRIQIEVVDETGTHRAYEATHQPGDSVQREVTAVGRRITIRLYDNDALRGDVTVE